MNRKNRGGDGGGASEWLNTYADMVTLLLTFFAVLISMSTVSKEKFNAFIKSFSNLTDEQIEEIIENSGYPTDEELTSQEVSDAINELYQKLLSYVKENGMGEAVSIHKVGDTVFIRFDSSVFFEPDKYVIRQGGYETLSFIGDGLKEYEKMIKVIAICGHTANIGDIPNDPISDWMLSGERSAVVAMYLEDQKKIDPKKMLLLGYGKNLPIADNSTEDGRMKNRRVELAIVSVNSNLSFDPYEGLSDLYNLSGGSNENTASGGSDTEKQTPAAGVQNSVAPDGVQKGVSPYD